MSPKNKFTLVDTFRGYVNKKDVTNLGADGYLVKGSQNVLSTDGETIKVRNGYTLDGAANTTISPILSSFDWDTSDGVERNLRSYQDNLEFRYVNSSGGVSWETLGTAGDSTYHFTTWWSATEVMDLLLLVNGNDYILEWSGAVTTFASATATTITKQGTTFWSENRFLTAGTRQIRVKDDGGTWRTFTYTGGEGTLTLTGITPDPTAFTITAGNIIAQAIRTNTSQPASGIQNDWISVLNNQVYVGSSTSRLIYISSNTSFTTYTQSTPRVPGEGAQLTLDGYCSGFAPLEDQMFVSAGKDSWFRVTFTLQPGSTADREVAEVKKLKTGPRQAAQDGDMIANVKNRIVFISNEPTLDELGRIENVDNPQQKPISDPIKTDFDELSFTNAHVKYFKNNIYVALPAESKVLIFNIARGFWEPPQILPVRRFAIIGGNLYGHSNSVPETYRLFNGTNDNTGSIAARAKFNYQHFGTRTDLKTFDEFWVEGYISGNTIDLTLKQNFDFDGYTQVIEQIISGEDTDITYDTTTDPSLGSEPLGDVSLGGDADTTSTIVKLHFTVIFTQSPDDFFKLQCSFETDATDRYWEILSFGPNVKLSKSHPSNIKKP